MNYINKKIAFVFAVFTIVGFFYYTSRVNEYKNITTIEIHIGDKKIDTSYSFMISNIDKSLKTKTFLNGKQEIKIKTISSEKFKSIYDFVKNNKVSKDTINSSIIITKGSEKKYLEVLDFQELLRLLK